eukprot:3626464-Heterocapsa_arctica.AAC.1
MPTHSVMSWSLTSNSPSKRRPPSFSVAATRRALSSTTSVSFRGASVSTDSTWRRMSAVATPQASHHK